MPLPLVSSPISVVAKLPWHLIVLVALVAASPTVMGCGPDCVDVPNVQVGMAATVERSGNAASVSLHGETFDDRAIPEPRRFLLGDISTFASGATWTVSAQGNQDDPLNWLAIQLHGSFGPGDVIPVVSVPETHLVGGWGGAPEGVRGIHVSAPGFSTASASGTLEVLAVAPLRLRVDVVAVGDTGEEIRVRGDMVAGPGHYEACLGD